jgi:hypothetical protein
MRAWHDCNGTLAALVCAASTALVMLACESQQPTSQRGTPSAVESKTAAATNLSVFVLFEGPWAFAPDPKDANSVLAIAARTALHHDLYVKASNSATLTAGIYDLSLPNRVGLPTGIADPSIVQAKVDPKSLDLALQAKSARYAIRIPKPEAYVTASRARSRVGATYPPDTSTEKDYATAVSLRYTVGTLSGFSLAGTPDRGTFDPFLLQVETPTVRFVIEPAHDDDPSDKCETHSREAFRDLTKLLNLTLYVDFPDNPSACHDRDPQRARGGNAASTRESRLQPAGVPRFQTASAIYFFIRPLVDCKGPDIILNPGP